MNIHPISSNTFTGYDARSLRGFLMSTNSSGIAEEMKRIGNKEGFKIFGFVNDGFSKNKCSEAVPNIEDGEMIWAQDIWTIVRNNLLCFVPDSFTQNVKDFFNLTDNFTQKINRESPIFNDLVNNFNISCLETKTDKDLRNKQRLENELRRYLSNNHIAGGNLFLIGTPEGEEVIIGENEMKKFSTDDIYGMFGTENITVLPQMDFHIDLFIRPLDKKRVLLADDRMTLNVLYNIYDKLIQYPNKYSNQIRKTVKAIAIFSKAIIMNKRAQTGKIEDILSDKGYKTIRVPGRFYQTNVNGDSLRHYCNYINADVLKNKQGQLVYITNKSSIDRMLGLTPEIIDEIGYSFEKSFTETLSQYINKDHIYFVGSTDNFLQWLLFNKQGGIHCISCEIPR